MKKMLIALLVLCMSATAMAAGKAVRDVDHSVIDTVKSNATAALVGMSTATNQATLRLRRADLNRMVLQLAVIEARKSGQATVGVVLPKHKAVVDAENSGTNLVSALADLGIACAVDLAAGNMATDALMTDLYAGVRVPPTQTDLARIEFYKGVAGLNAFIRQYNGL